MYGLYVATPMRILLGLALCGLAFVVGSAIFALHWLFIHIAMAFV